MSISQTWSNRLTQWWQRLNPFVRSAARSRAAEKLARAFPKSHREVALDAVKLLGIARTVSPHVFGVDVEGEPVAIPYRIYGTDIAIAPTQQPARDLANCLLTRHCDGFVRAKALDAILLLNKPWSVPFVVSLVGEYVVEILGQIDGALDSMDQKALGDFVRSNPDFMYLTAQRVVSYWNCYYRCIPRDVYVGFRLLEKLRKAGTAS